MGDRWGAAGPPEDAYSRVTDPSIYAPLHGIARDLIDELEARYDVTRVSGVEVVPQTSESAPVIGLIPRDPTSSQLSITFTAFPGLWVLTGRTARSPIPVCGCDACDETLDDCADVLREHIEAVVAGTLGERLLRHDDGHWWHDRWYTSDSGSTTGSGTPVSSVERRALRTLLGGDELTYSPWAGRSRDNTR